MSRKLKGIIRSRPSFIKGIVKVNKFKDGYRIKIPSNSIILMDLIEGILKIAGFQIDYKD